MELEFKIIKHKDVDLNTIHEICNLKDENWPYGLSKQMQWMTENISDHDYHILAYSESIIGYVNLVHREILINNDYKVNVLGIGNVCLANEFKRKGLGLRLMGFVANFLEENDISGVLFCKESLVPFYDKNGWSLINDFQIIDNPDVKTMVYNFKEKKIEKMELIGLQF